MDTEIKFHMSQEIFFYIYIFYFIQVLTNIGTILSLWAIANIGWIGPMDNSEG